MSRARGRSLRLAAPAKLNLFLQITGRRADGYHELQTIFQLLDWGDTVKLDVLDAPQLERGVAIAGVSEADDLSLRAARSLQARARGAGRPFAGARISIDKVIPQGSGLGGASSDAATVLLGLNALWGCGFTLPELATLGLELGADVPVFVHGASAWAEGVGERLTPLALGERHYVLLFPGEGASTAALFADPALERDAKPLPAPQGPGDGLGVPAANAFFPVLKRRSPAVAAAAEKLAEYGVPRLSGSGSTLFLEVPDKTDANRVTTALKKHYNVRAVRGTDRSVLLDQLPCIEHER